MTDRLRAIFKTFDKNSDGNISREEFAKVMNDGNITMDAVTLQTFFDKIDQDHNGSIDYKEFCYMMQHLAELQDTVIGSVALTLTAMQDMFASGDIDGDGKISTEELYAMLKELLFKDKPFSMDDAQSVLNQFDRDGDGSIDFPEFCAMMQILHPEDGKHPLPVN